MRQSCSTELVNMVVTNAHSTTTTEIHGFTTTSSSHVEMVTKVMVGDQPPWTWILCRRLVLVVVTHVVVMDVEDTRKSRVTIVASLVIPRNNVSKCNATSSSRDRTKSSRGWTWWSTLLLLLSKMMMQVVEKTEIGVPSFLQVDFGGKWVDCNLGFERTIRCNWICEW